MDALTMQQRVELAATLLRTTQDGTLQWVPQRGSQYVFSSSLRRFGAYIASRDNDDLHPYVLTIVSGQPSTEDTSDPLSAIDSYTSDETGSEVHQQLNSLLRDLYRVAKRTALGLDALVNDLFADLRSLDEEVFTDLSPMDDDEPF